MTHRIVTFGGSAISIACDGPEASWIVDFVFRGFGFSGGPDPHVAFDVRGAHADETLVLRCADVELYRGKSLGALGRILSERAAFHLSDRSSGGLLLHAAAVRRDGSCVLLPGKTGTGKSTLTAWLSANGYDYLTDELAYIPVGTARAIPFARPLNLRRGGMSALKAADEHVGAHFEVVTGDGHDLCRPVRERPVASTSAEISTIVFPRFDPSASFSADPLPGAETALYLMESLINARNLPRHGHDEASRIARRIPGFRVRYSDFTQVEHWMSFRTQTRDNEAQGR